ncbi:hypothetical protein L483_18805 [Pseudomonas putida H8234]|nr:hypothetical protein L483_18805 [Pseudomonas putida H8234]
MKAAGCLWGQMKLFYCRTIFVDKKMPRLRQATWAFFI